MSDYYLIRSWFSFNLWVLSRPAVFSSCAHIPYIRHIFTKVWWESVAMVMRYDVKSSRWSSHFWRKMSTKTSKMFNCHILHVQHQFPIFNVFWQFLIFDKIKDGAQNGGHLGRHHRLPAAGQSIICTSSCRAHHRLSTKGEIFSKCCNITKKPKGGPWPPGPCTTVGVWFCLFIQGLMHVYKDIFCDMAKFRCNPWQ